MKKYKRIHFIGISGIGMSGIARVLLELGCDISGSDLKRNRLTGNLESLGAKVYIGHDPSNIKGVDLIVASSAIPSNNPEITAALEFKIPVIKRAEMLGYLMKSRFGITVAGTHGKTTTTSMIVAILEKNGFNPTVIVGGELNDWGANARLGKDKYLVAEADESDASFLNLFPKMTVITNIDADINPTLGPFAYFNFDYEQTLNKVIETFEEFINKLPRSGKAVVCVDNKNVQKILPKIHRNYLTYGLENEANLTVKDFILEENKSTSKILYNNKLLGELNLNIPGKHNILNALASIGIGLELGLNFKQISSALAFFKGVQRRFQILGEEGGILVVDDYAHNPAKIKATLQAARKGYKRRIVAVFQPHRYTRTKFLLKEFSSAFTDSDILIITDIYSAGETPMIGVKAENIVKVVKENDSRPEVIFIPNKDLIEDYLFSICRQGDIVITLGAGDIGETAKKFYKRLLISSSKIASV
ncbi:MAG: UDP-N-acetylmuramate--L-alanine ligase [Armatimonadetes bacterium]|nr:UDP-N-acetylmuramate--L-alanine ligase [Armatimonadota bacterium]